MTKAPPDDLACCATALRKASRRLALLYDDALSSTGLKSTQYAILVELSRHPEAPPTMQELAKALVLDRSTLGHNLRPLERDGWLAMQENAADARSRHVVLTRAGKAKVAEAKLRWQAAQDRFVEVFGKTNAARLRKTLLSIAHDDRLGI